ncbi:MAG: hypothetical protein NVS1B11_15480 [Terriglobales bacterium]
MVFVFATALCSLAQMEQVPVSPDGPGETQAPPRYDSDRAADESSSRDTKIDLSPPKDDAKDHPNSGAALSDTNEDAAGDVQELHPWDPHKAAKDVEVGDFYYKRKNYRAALARYQDALIWKDNYADANFRMAQCFEKLNNPGEAATHYEAYLKILPHGPFAPDAQQALTRLKPKTSAQDIAPKQPQ